MRILALETSGTSGSVAVLEGSSQVAQLILPPGQRSARSLVPTIQDLLGRVGWEMSQIGLVAVTSGPGSFTSLRIGVSTAKALAYAVGAEIIGVNTLGVIARQAPRSIGSSKRFSTRSATSCLQPPSGTMRRPGARNPQA